MTSPAFVQTKANGATANSTSNTVVLDATPTNGNLLLAVVHHHANEDAAISGWTARTRSANSASSATQVFWLIASSTSATIQATWTTSTRGEIAVVEISGPDTTTPLEVVVATLDTTTPFTSGNAAAASGGDKLLVGLLGAEGATTPSAPVATGTGTGTATLRGTATSSGANGGGVGIFTCPVTGASGNYTTRLAGSSNGSIWAILVAAPATAIDAWKHAGARFVLRATAWKHAGARFRLLVNATQDIGARFRLTTPQFRDVAARFSLLGSTVRDVAVRFRVEARAYSDRAVRLRLAGRAYADVTARFKLLGGNATRDVAARLRLAGQGYSHRALRFRLRATAWSDRALRFTVRVPGFRDRTVRFIPNRIVHLASGANADSSATVSTGLTAPTVGSTLIVHLFLRGIPTVTAAAGWTLAVQATTSDALQKVAVLYHRAGPSDGTFATIATLSSSTTHMVVYDEYSALGALLAATATASDGATKTSSLTSPGDGALALAVASTVGFGGPAAWTSQAINGADSPNPVTSRVDTGDGVIATNIFDRLIRETSGNYTAQADDSSLALGAATLTMFGTNREWARNVGLRFVLTSPTYKFVAARFRLVLSNYTHRALRFRLRATAYADRAVRCRLVLGNVSDRAVRFRLRVTSWADTAIRFRLAVTTWSHAAVRFVLKAPAYNDVALRFVLRVTTWRDAGARFSVGPPNWSQAAARFRLLASAWSDRAARFRLRASTYADRSARFRLQILQYLDVVSRFRLVASSWRDAALRLRLRAFTAHDADARFRVETSSVTVSHGSSSDAQIQTGDQRDDTTPTVQTGAASGVVTVQTGS